MPRRALFSGFLIALFLIPSGCSPQRSSDKAHFLASQDAYNEAIWIVNSGNSLMMEEEAGRLIELLETALAEARLVDDDFLASFHREHAFYYRNKYQIGLETWIRGMKRKQPLSAVEGQNLVRQYVDWFAQVRRSR